MTPADILKARPERVAMVGLGPSANAFWLENSQFNEAQPFDAVWTLNRGATSFRHDVSFDMHDLRRMVKRYPQEQRRFVEADKPIITLRHYPEYPMTVKYPLQEVIDCVRHDILNSTPAYMVAWAITIGVKEITLYGMDFHYENLDRAEAGGQGLAYLLAQCQERGINYKIPSTSSMLDAYKVHIVDDVPMRPLYGYHESEDPECRDPRIKEDAKVVPLSRVQRGNQMSAEEPRYRLGEAEVGDVAAGGAR